MYDEERMAMRPAEKAKAQREIDVKIRQMYDETVGEELPDRFRKLLEKLRESDGVDRDSGNLDAGSSEGGTTK